jgi:hypothetical protein
MRIDERYLRIPIRSASNQIERQADFIGLEAMVVFFLVRLQRLMMKMGADR